MHTYNPPFCERHQWGYETDVYKRQVETPIWDQYMTLVEACDSRGRSAIGHIERFAFYEEAKKAYAIIATSEKALYANIMLQKGVVTDQGL